MGPFEKGLELGLRWHEATDEEKAALADELVRGMSPEEEKLVDALEEFINEIRQAMRRAKVGGWQ